MAPPRVPRVAKVCVYCGVGFAIAASNDRRGYGTYCSRDCGAKAKSEQSPRVQRTCATCGKGFTLLASQTIKPGTGNYCSMACSPRVKAERVERTCEHCHKGFSVKLSRLLAGKVKGIYCSLSCQRESQKKPWGPAKSRPGIESWRRAVLSRDGHACQQCGATEALRAHHVKPWADYPDLRYELANGLTLCDLCHRALHHPHLAA